jgi:dipeptide/tripeptide permease
MKYFGLTVILAATNINESSPRNDGEIGQKDPIVEIDAEKNWKGPSDGQYPDEVGHRDNNPTEEENRTLRRVAGSIPAVAYWLCAVEFAERASYYGVQPLFANFVNKDLPAGGNGAGATKVGTQDSAGALGLGHSTANAVSQSFSMLCYTIPVYWGWLADQKTGRWPIICWGVAVCGVAHVIMVGSAAPVLLQARKAVAPFMISVYTLAIGAGMKVF